MPPAFLPLSLPQYVNPRVVQVDTYHRMLQLDALAMPREPSMPPDPNAAPESESRRPESPDDGPGTSSLGSDLGLLDDLEDFAFGDYAVDEALRAALPLGARGARGLRDGEHRRALHLDRGAVHLV